jgi:uncharacterized SAM-binding protein YcdF (DUF218 family)
LWLTAAAGYLIVSDGPHPADALIVLGGGTGDREQTGAQLYRAGYAPEVLTTGESLQLVGVPATFADLSAQALERAGVPAERIHRLSTSASTCDDARLSRQVLADLGAQSLIVVSDPFHMRRAMMLFEREYAGSGIRLIPVAASPSWFDLNRWWTREKEYRVVVEEYIKLAYYAAYGCPAG